MATAGLSLKLEVVFFCFRFICFDASIQYDVIIFTKTELSITL